MSVPASGGSNRPRTFRPVFALAGFVALFATAASVAYAVQRAPSVEHQVKVHAGLYESHTYQNSLWVTAVGSSLISGARLVELDARTLEEKRVIDMGDAAAFGVTVNRNTGMAYTTNTRAGNIGVVNLRSGEIRTISDPDADGNPHLYGIVVDHDNNMIYASVAQTPGEVWVIDGATNTLDRIIDAGGSRPTGIVVDGAANRLYVANMGDDFISVIDLGSDRVIDRIPTVGGRSTRLAHDAAGGRLFVGNQASNDLSVIDLKQMRAVRRVATGEQPVGVAYHPVNNQIFVANRGSGTVSVIDGETYETIDELEIGTFPNDIHVDETTGMVYVTNKSARTPRGEEPTIDPRGDMVTLISP